MSYALAREDIRDNVYPSLMQITQSESTSCLLEYVSFLVHTRSVVGLWRLEWKQRPETTARWEARYFNELAGVEGKVVSRGPA